MKIIHRHYGEFGTVERAIDNATIPNPYSYEGQFEKLQEENKILRDIVARLVETIYGEYKNNSAATRLQYILGYGYEVEE